MNYTKREIKNPTPVTDFTADVVRVKLNSDWEDPPKVGCQACDNPALERIW